MTDETKQVPKNKRDLIRKCQAILTEAYEEAAVMLMLWLDGHPKDALATLCREVDPENWNALRLRVQRADAARKADGDAFFAARARENQRKDRSAAKGVLQKADPSGIRDLLAPLANGQLEVIIREAHDLLMAEAETREPTERWDPSSDWADKFILRVNKNMVDFTALVQARGLVLGSLSQDEALAYLDETERLVAEIRVVLQERVRDQVMP